jgi:hypothetical protein
MGIDSMESWDKPLEPNRMSGCRRCSCQWRMPAAVALVSAMTVALIGVGVGFSESAKAHQSSVAAFRINAATYAERLRAVLQSYETGLELAASAVNTRGFSAASLRTGIRYAYFAGVLCDTHPYKAPGTRETQSHCLTPCAPLAVR